MGDMCSKRAHPDELQPDFVQGGAGTQGFLLAGPIMLKELEIDTSDKMNLVMEMLKDAFVNV